MLVFTRKLLIFLKFLRLVLQILTTGGKILQPNLKFPSPEVKFLPPEVKKTRCSENGAKSGVGLATRNALFERAPTQNHQRRVPSAARVGRGDDNSQHCNVAHAERWDLTTLGVTRIGMITQNESALSFTKIKNNP